MAKPRRVRFGWQRLFQILLQAAFLLSVPGTCAGTSDEETEAAQTGTQPASDPLPFRLEFGGYYSWVDQGFGDWRGLNAEFWWRGNARFVPAFLVDSQTRPAGTQQNYAFTSYLNWRPSFYTTQSVSVAPQGSDLAIYFPKVRYDLKGHWKLRRDRNVVMAAGFTYFDYGRPGQGQIYNAGTIYYRGKLVLEGNFYLNRSQPGDLWSSSGNVAAQYGTEGRYWAGVTFGGGEGALQAGRPHPDRCAAYQLHDPGFLSTLAFPTRRLCRRCYFSGQDRRIQARRRLGAPVFRVLVSQHSSLSHWRCSIRNALLLSALAFLVSGGFMASANAQSFDIALLDSANTAGFMRYWYSPACTAPSFYLSDEYKRYFLGWRWVLMREGFSYQVVQDKDITLSGLANYKALILSNDALLSDDQSRAVQQWVIRGGRLLATFGSGYKDLASDPRQQDGWKQQKGGTFGLHQLWHDPVGKAFSTYWIDAGVDVKITRYEGPTAGLLNFDTLPLKNDVLPYGAEANLLVNRPANHPDVLAFLIIDNPAWKANSPAIISTRQGKGLVVYFAFAPEYMVYKELEGSANLPQGWPSCPDGQSWVGRGQQVWPLMVDTIRYLIQ